MIAEKIEIEFIDLTAKQNQNLSTIITSFRFTNFITALSPVAEVVFNQVSISSMNFLSLLLKKKAAVTIYVTKNNIKYTLLKGYVLKLNNYVSNANYNISFYVVANTYAIFEQQMRSYELDSSIDYKPLINNLLKTYGLNKTYDQIIFPNNTTLEIDSSLYSSTGQTVYNYLEQILNDLHIKVFTTCYKIGAKDQQILYFYDTGDYAESVISYEQTLTNNNVLERELNIDWSHFPDKIIIESDQGFNDDSPEITKTISTKDLKSLGLNKINDRTNINIPEIILSKKIKSASSDIDAQNYAISMLRDSVNNGLQIQIKTNSLYIDIFHKTDCWALGKKINIDNDIMRNDFKYQFSIYLQNNKKYYFVLTGIDYIYDDTGISCSLTISPSELIYFK